MNDDGLMACLVELTRKRYRKGRKDELWVRYGQLMRLRWYRDKEEMGTGNE